MVLARFVPHGGALLSTNRRSLDRSGEPVALVVHPTTATRGQPNRGCGSLKGRGHLRECSLGELRRRRFVVRARQRSGLDLEGVEALGLDERERYRRELLADERAAPKRERDDAAVVLDRLDGGRPIYPIAGQVSCGASLRSRHTRCAEP